MWKKDYLLEVYEGNYIWKKFHQEPWTSKLKLPNLVAVLSQKKKNKLENETRHLTWTLKLFHSDKTYKAA